jgi:hypothetical protein
MKHLAVRRLSSPEYNAANAPINPQDVTPEVRLLLFLECGSALLCRFCFCLFFGFWLCYGFAAGDSAQTAWTSSSRRARPEK